MRAGAGALAAAGLGTSREGSNETMAHLHERRSKQPRRRTGRVFCAAVAAACTAGLLGFGVAPAGADPVTAAHPGGSHALDAAQFKGVNWADPRDNYVNGPVVPTGLSTGDTYRTVYIKATRILHDFRSDTGANTVRLPFNPYSVGTAWWKSYQGVVDAATQSGFKVILSYWEGSDAAKDGKVDDPAAWTAMWNTLTSTYKQNPRVYFEPMNEPFGYSQAQWESLVSTWVTTYAHKGIPRDRMFVSGTGYNDHVNSVCGVAALQGTYVSQHFYGYWATDTYNGWVNNFTDRLGDQSCSDRTVLDEFGSPMTNGFDYRASATASDADTNNYVAYLQATTDIVRARHMGAVYWPGLRAGDSYSLETLQGWGTHLHLTVNDPTGVTLLRWAWGYGHRLPHPTY